MSNPITIPHPGDLAAVCYECEKPLSKEEIEDPVDFGDGPLCTDCECENHHWTCDFCEECEDEEYTAEIFAVHDGEAAGIPAGVYHILARPFYRQGMIGGGEIFADRVKRVADVPAEQEEGFAPCSMLCRECAKPYLKMVKSEEIANAD